jgi:hypothetical protein
MIDVPSRFLHVRYDGARVPGVAVGLGDGANCQVFAYALLRHFGFEVGPLRSSELWTDTRWTRRVDEMEPLDLVLFNGSEEAWGAHVGVCVEPGRVIHLCKEIGTPVVWGLDEFRSRPRYAVLVGIKRPTTRLTGT